MCSTPATTESTWLNAALQGDQHAFAQLVTAYQQPIFNFCYRLLGDANQAEDAAQEVFIRAFCKLQSYKPGHKFSTWLYAIAHHYVIDLRRKRHLQLVSLEKHPFWSESLTDGKNEPERIVETGENAALAHDLVQSLPDQYRSVVVLRYWQQLSYDEITEVLGISLSTVKNRLFRAKKLMARTHQRIAQKAPQRRVMPQSVPASPFQGVGLAMA